MAWHLLKHRIRLHDLVLDFTLTVQSGKLFILLFYFSLHVHYLQDMLQFPCLKHDTNYIYIFFLQFFIVCQFLMAACHYRFTEGLL